MGTGPQSPPFSELRPIIKVIGVGGAGGNAINNMIASGLQDVDYIVANTDAQALASSGAEQRIQLGVNLTQGLGAGSRPEIGLAAAEEAKEEITKALQGAHMAFIAAGMGGGTGTGAAAVIARTARDMGLLTVAIVTKPFHFEGARRMRVAEAGISELKTSVDTLIVIPNQNLFRIANERTTFAEAFVLADKVLHAGVACIVDLIMKDGLINLDFADVQVIMRGMGAAMMGTGEASGEERARKAAEMALANPLIDDLSLSGAKGVLLSIIGGRDMTLFEVDEAASRVRQEVDEDANIIVGASFDDSMSNSMRIAIVASGMGVAAQQAASSAQTASAARAQDAPTASAAPTAREMHRRRFDPEDLNPRAGYYEHEERIAPSDHAAQPERASGHGGNRELWRAPGGVVIEENGGAQHGRASAPVDWNEQPTAPPPMRHAGDADYRRMPSVEEFPPVGQREYAAKAPVYSGQQSRVQPLEPPVPPEPPRGGLLQRLVGGAKGRRS